MVTTVAVAGAAGRLGRVICQVIAESSDYELVAKLGRQSSKSDYAGAEILVDATHFAASQQIVAAALERGQRVLVATSGWGESEIALLEQQVAGSALFVPNFSLGSVLGSALAKIAAPYFQSVEIIETHHPQKIDSPSGTAVRTAQLISAARAGLPEAAFREQTARGEIVSGVPVHSLRQHGTVATQEVRLGGSGESLEIVHRTVSSDSYVAGIKASLDYVRKMAVGFEVGLEKALGLNL